MDILSKLSERLKDLMNEAQIKTPALAEKTNLEQSVISKFLRAERMPSAKSLVTLADCFHCSTDYLLGLSDVLDEREFKQRPPFNEQLSFLLEHYHITKYRLEKETKLTEETVNRWHKGKYEPTVESLVRLATYFNCSVDFILGREN
ncbi:MAG: helix-turn-helix transcriptional regulator [Candidatus Coproplasma sp.]